MRLFLSHRIITTFASGNSVVSFRYSFSPRNLLLQVAFIERESQYGSCSLSRFVERGGRRKMFERFNVVPSARVLPVQNSQGMVSCRGSVPRKKRIRATTRYTEYCRRPEKLLCRSPKSVPPFKISPSPHKNAAKKMQLHSAEENAAKKIHLLSGYTFVSKNSIFLREYPRYCRNMDILGKAATPLSL